MNSLSHHLPTPDKPSGQSATELLRLNYWCDQFETAWRLSSPCDIAEFWQRVPLEDRNGLASELILIDIELRQQRDLPAPIEQYAALAPDVPRQWLESQVAVSASRDASDGLNSLPAGHQLGDYTIVRRIGEGGMGVVYCAEHRLMKRQVALKVIQHQSHLSKVAQRRFEREVRAAAQLTHPNIVVAHDARQADGWIYLVTELIAGETIDSLTKRDGPLSIHRAVDIALQAARGLEYAHQKGIIHRDIKPANLLIDTQQCVKILDLGLARWLNEVNAVDVEVAGDASALTSSFEMLGTAQFMAPEQARSAGSADERSDIYALGCTLFFMLTGEPPYSGISRLEICMAHVNAPVPLVSSRLPSTPKAVDSLLQTWLAKDPSERPASMSRAIEQLESLRQEMNAAASQPTRASDHSASRDFVHFAPANVARGWRPTRRTTLLSGMATLAVGFSALGFATARRRGWLGGGSTPNSSLRRITNAEAPGLRFTGDGYLEVAEFGVPVEHNMAIEAWARPEVNRTPSNLVTWTGPKSLVLFCDEATRWGAAYFDGHRSQLILADELMDKPGHQLVAASWNGNRLQLHLDGRPIITHPISYDLVPAAPRLYIGGIPDGVILPSQGTRFFQGEINAVRILQSQKPLVLADTPQQLAVTDQTIALFDFGSQPLSSSEPRMQDLTGHWQGTMHWTSTSER